MPGPVSYMERSEHWFCVWVAGLARRYRHLVLGMAFSIRSMPAICCKGVVTLPAAQLNGGYAGVYWAEAKLIRCFTTGFTALNVSRRSSGVSLSW